MAEELKRCPFCGGKPKEYDQIGYSSVKCKRCKFSIKVKSMDGPPYAPELWNTRAHVPSQGGVVLADDYARLEQECITAQHDKALAAYDLLRCKSERDSLQRVGIRTMEERDAALKQVEGFLEAGKPLSNVAYNLAQKVGYTLTEQDCEMLIDLRKRWDATMSAKPCAPTK